MKIHQLGLAVFVAVGLLIACSDNKEKPTQNTKAGQTQSIKMTVNEAANQAETRYKGLATLNNRLFDAVNNNFLFQDVKAVVDHYQRGENDATADTTLTLIPNPNVFENDHPVIFQTRDTITYNQALLDRGVIANIQSQPIISHDELAQITHLPEKSIAKIQEILNHLQIQTELLSDDNVATKTEIRPFQLETHEGSVDFQGAVLDTNYNEKAILENIGAGSSEFTIHPVLFNSTRDNAEVTLDTIQGKYQLSRQGNLSFEINPIKFHVKNSRQDYIFESDGISAEGQHYIFDPILREYIGTVKATMNNINLTSNGVKTHYGDIEYTDSTIKNIQGNYDIQTRYHFKLDGTAIQQQWALPVKVNNIVADNEIRNLSPESIQSLMQLFALDKNATQQELSLQVQQILNTMLNNLVLNQTGENILINVETDAGNIALKLNLSANKDSKINLADNAWEQAFTQAQKGNLFPLKSLLEAYVNFSAVLSVDKSLVDAVGATAVLEKQFGLFITLKDGKYQLELENSGTGLKLNGHPLPF